MSRLRTRALELRHKLHSKYFANFIFVHINKAGGSSVEQALGLPLKNHTTAIEYRELLGEARWKRVFTFSLVRNPWDRAVSQYHFRIQTAQTGMDVSPPTFTEWIRRTYGEQDPALFNNPKFFAPQYRWISDEAGELIVDMVCKLENITEDFATVCAHINRQVPIPHVNRTKRGPYRDYYDSDTQEVIRRWFERDIELFEYTF